MLLELRVENYRSIADEQVLLMSASKDSSLEQNVTTAGRVREWRLLKSVVLYGANGAGKSNFVRAAGLMRHLVVHSATSYQAGESLPIEPFRLDPERASSPSTIEMTFLHQGVRYQYGFAADSERIHDEWLLWPTRRDGRRPGSSVRAVNGRSVPISRERRSASRT